MQLKNYADVQWQDLPKIESPALARAWVESNAPLTDHTLYRIDGLQGSLRDPLNPGDQDWDDHARDGLLERIDRAEVVLVYGFAGEPMDPVVRRSDGESAWSISTSLKHEAQSYVERMLTHASETRGIWQPILASQEPRPAPEAQPREEPEELTVTNPRWEHVDQNRAESSPDTAMVGDLVRLMADVTGAADGSRAIFKVLDTSISPPSRVGSARGEVEGGIGTAEWEVKTGRRGAQLEFEASVRRVGSERAELPVAEAFGFTFSF